VRLAANDLDLDSAQQLLAFLESQSDLLRRQVGNRPSDWPISYPRAPTYVPLPDTTEIDNGCEPVNLCCSRTGYWKDG
jgi:hypothetical protein